MNYDCKKTTAQEPQIAPQRVSWWAGNSLWMPEDFIIISKSFACDCKEDFGSCL